LTYDARSWTTNREQFASVLVRADTYARVGEFDPKFKHVADWNMWWRIARTERVAYSNVCVGLYRMFEGNHTSTLQRSGTNLRESIEQIDRLCASEPGVDRASLYRDVASMILVQARSYAGDKDAFKANFGLLKLLPKASIPKLRRLNVLLEHWLAERR
jgi:hypothetical protein